MSYAVVKNNHLEFYVVPKKWLTKVDDDEKQYTLYPATKMKKYVEAMKDPQNDWPMEEVTIVCNDIADLKLANQLIDIKCMHSNSEASDLDKMNNKPQKKKSLKREKNVDDDSFNTMFDEESSSHKQKQTKLDNANENQIVPETQNIDLPQMELSSGHRFSTSALQDNIGNDTILSQNYSLPTINKLRPNLSIFNDSSSERFSSSNDRFQEDHSIQNLCIRPETQDYNFASSGTGGSMMFVNKITIEQLVRENIQLRKNQESLMEMMNTMSLNFRKEFAALKEMIRCTRNVEQDVTFRPKQVCTIEELNTIEKKLETLPEAFVDQYKKTIDYYSSTIKIPNKGFGPQNGYMHSLMVSYFERDFAKSLIWSSTKHQKGFDSYENHLLLFKNICNKVEVKAETKLFTSMTEVHKAVQAFFKSIHAKPRASKSNIEDHEKNGEDRNNVEH